MALHHCYSSRCRLVASLTTTRTQPCTHPRVPPTSPNPYTLHTGPVPTTPGSLVAPKPTSRQLAVMPSFRATPWRAASPSWVLLHPGRCGSSLLPPPSRWRGATEGFAQCNAEICLGSCPRGGWHVLGLIPQLPVPLRVSILSGTPLGAERCRSSPMEPAGITGGVPAPLRALSWQRGAGDEGAAPVQAGGCCNAEGWHCRCHGHGIRASLHRWVLCPAGARLDLPVPGLGWRQVGCSASRAASLGHGPSPTAARTGHGTGRWQLSARVPILPNSGGPGGVLQPPRGGFPAAEPFAKAGSERCMVRRGAEPSPCPCPHPAPGWR